MERITAVRLMAQAMVYRSSFPFFRSTRFVNLYKMSIRIGKEAS